MPLAMMVCDAQGGALRVKGWPVAAGVSGVVREFARSLNSEDVFALWSLTVCPTGPIHD